jgi:hypothetical protein
LAKLWIAARRPLAVALGIGCAASLMAHGTVTPRLALPAALYWSFVPLLQIAGLALILGKDFSAEAIDDFFSGHGPWLLWLGAFAAFWAFVPGPVAYGKTGFPQVWYALAAVAAVWSAWLDFAFFRRIRRRSPKHAARDVLVQRLVCWPIGMIIFVAPAGWQTVAARLGL